MALHALADSGRTTFLGYLLQGVAEMLARMRELVSMIHLAKFTDAPGARAQGLIAQVEAFAASAASLPAEDAHGQ